METTRPKVAVVVPIVAVPARMAGGASELTAVRVTVTFCARLAAVTFLSFTETATRLLPKFRPDRSATSRAMGP